MSEKVYIEKEISVVTDQEVAKNLKTTNGLPMRKWKVSLYSIDDETSEKCPLNFVDRVEYLLHPTFENPERVIKKPPFTLSEKGWGEFDMKIILHFTDKSIQPWTIEHDLNFKKSHYEVIHKLKFFEPKPPFRKMISQEISLESSLSPKIKSGRPKRIKSSSSISSKRQKTELSFTPTYDSLDSTSPSCSNEAMNGKQKFQVDYNKLAKNLYELEGEDILEVIHLVNEHRTSEMYINEEVEEIMAEYKGASSEGQRQAMLEKQRAKMLSDFEKQREKIAKDNQVNINTSKFVTQYDDVEDSLKKETIDSSSPPPKKSKLGKNPNVDTSFLPDRDREEEERKEREQLRLEWLRKQEEIKNEKISVTYSYWDGTGHRKTVSCKKGDSIADFLEKCRQQFHELRGVSVDNLIYVKEDLIIPHHYTFYDFIINKARGKSGPLFNFDVHDDIRLTHDATIEKDESHAGKVVERNWYEKNKHIFPASRWEVYDPEKNYGKYTIKDTNKKPGSL
ncbi:644_t:CDS:10 [Diversispora eburnea]|uniref:644_t:CDS:1 n=1 Tax=Diversispora eburnea TaxID=1213867 RepID=A0A9N8ZI42_9GLOM|nr:644_t:CDS:10 [Diversispora eburnea]